VVFAADFHDLLKRAPLSCREILIQAADKIAERDDVFFFDPGKEEYLAAVQTEGIRIVMDAVEEIEASVVELYEQRDALDGLGGWKRFLLRRLILQKIKATRTPEFLTAYRGRIREWLAEANAIRALWPMDVYLILEGHVSDGGADQKIHP